MNDANKRIVEALDRLAVLHREYATARFHLTKAKYVCTKHEGGFTRDWDEYTWEDLEPHVLKIEALDTKYGSHMEAFLNILFGD